MITRIARYGFNENQDYVSFHKVMGHGENRSGGTTRKECAIKLFMANELFLLPYSIPAKNHMELATYLLTR
ncbi:MAG: antA/AntB antirepressor family protein [Bacteroidales bacterium]|nr:antA/AntB antirepressor family protein [Bacteroidales bacterium]